MTPKVFLDGLKCFIKKQIPKVIFEITKDQKTKKKEEKKRKKKMRELS